jgi:hypothetical protein
MSRNNGQRAVVKIPIDDMKVSAADAARRHLHKQLALARLGQRALLQHEGLAATMQHHRSHAFHRNLRQASDQIPQVWS